MAQSRNILSLQFKFSIDESKYGLLRTFCLFILLEALGFVVCTLVRQVEVVLWLWMHVSQPDLRRRIFCLFFRFSLISFMPLVTEIKKIAVGMVTKIEKSQCSERFLCEFC